MQNHRRRQHGKLSWRLRHPHCRFIDSKTPRQQRHFNWGSKVHDIVHLKFLFDDSPNKKIICENENFWFSWISHIPLQLRWKSDPRWIRLCCHEARNVWAYPEWNPGPNTRWNTYQCPWVPSEQDYTWSVNTWMAYYMFHARCGRFWSKVCW